jgi:hypothetical protein
MGPDSKSEALRSVQSLRLLIGAALFVAAASAAAQSAQSSIYSCTSNGRTYSGDRPPPECANSDIRELNRDGSLRRVIPRPLTVDEQRARALEAKKRLEDEERMMSQRRRDRSLLEAYANEDEIEAARTKALDSSQVVIARSSQRIENLKIEKKRLDDESEFYKKREVPDSIKRGYILNAQSLSAEESVIGEARAEMQRINERFDAEKKRFRELLAQGARPVQRNPEPDILLDPRFRGK